MGALAVRGLRVALPDGRVLIDGIDLSIGEGEVVVLLGGSGAGKSTFARVLFEREELADAGFDVGGSLELAIRHAKSDDTPETWLERVGLDAELAEPGTPVTKLSGGQAQRVAVARVLASKRKLLFLD